MPIRFRCNRCNRLLGIARRKAGADTICPHCGATIRVPAGTDDRTELSEIDELLNPASAAAPLPLPAQVSSPPAPVRKPPVAVAAPLPVEDRPLFERDLDAVLGVKNNGDDRADARKEKPTAAAGMDAISLNDERGHVVLSSQKATALAVAIVVLLALSFTVGYLVGAK